ncbi:MAG: 16S rRNA (guanine(527)-N(7))-methyltransferase RsmG [Terriglobales bacterium]
MDIVRIGELLLPFAPSLSDKQLSSISIYLDLLQRWNARMNLTAIRDPETIVTRHFGESLFAARHLLTATANSSVIDVGSGAGFPGLPMKLWAQNIQLTLIESSQKKATFLREVVRALDLTDIEVFAGRAESFRGTSDVVTLRAVERFKTALPIAAKLLRSEGKIAALISVSQCEIIGKSSLIQWRTPIPVPRSNQRILAIGLAHLQHQDSTL